MSFSLLLLCPDPVVLLGPRSLCSQDKHFTGVSTARDVRGAGSVVRFVECFPSIAQSLVLITREVHASPSGKTRSYHLGGVDKRIRSLRSSSAM